jgi:hypothetical protein
VRGNKKLEKIHANHSGTGTGTGTGVLLYAVPGHKGYAAVLLGKLVHGLIVLIYRFLCESAFVSIGRDKKK